MFTVAEHWRHFADFAKWEKASGGPDPQLAMVGAMSHRVGGPELWWRAGCYIAVYNVPFAEVIWRDWPWARMRQESGEVRGWLDSNWSRITTRVERRCVRRPDWMESFLIGYAAFAAEREYILRECERLDPADAYDFAWDRALQVPRLGRYVALKLLEFLRRYGGLCAEPPDIRPAGGWSPRATLAMLWERPEAAARDDRPETLALVDALARDTCTRLAGEFEIEVDLFQLQVLLCEYRESWEGRRQYPGRSLDSELKYARAAEEKWGIRSTIWKARERTFPMEHLGEMNGWDGPREGPANCLADWGYTWTDMRYVYADTQDYGAPSLRVGVAPPTVKMYSGADVRRGSSAPRLYTILEGRLYQSARWSTMSVEEGRALARQYGVTGLANFWKAAPGIGEMVEWYRHWPLPDGRRVPDVRAIVDELEAYIRAGGVLVSMCYGGRNRSGLVSAMLLQRLEGISGVEAIERVRTARRGALNNEYFCAWLRGAPPDGTLPGYFF